MSSDREPGPKEWITAVLIWAGLAIAVMAFGLWRAAYVMTALAKVELHLQRQDHDIETIIQTLSPERSARPLECQNSPKVKP